jgi:predicted NUDIX family NTP pyrophosphohydrolase
MYRRRAGQLEVFLAHPGGPLFVHKDQGHWTVPKGEIQPGEELLAAALREFQEEIGIEPSAPFLELGTIVQKGGKRVHAWAFLGDWLEGQLLQSNLFTFEWPRFSGRQQSFPEIDRAQFFALAEARMKIKEAQAPFLDRLEAALE